MSTMEDAKFENSPSPEVILSGLPATAASGQSGTPPSFLSYCLRLIIFSFPSLVRELNHCNMILNEHLLNLI